MPHINYKPWGNPIDVPHDDFERYYYARQEIPEKEENERAILIKSFPLPVKTKFKSDYSTEKSKKKSMSIGTLRSTQQRRRRRRRRQIDLNVSTDCSLEGHYNFIENSSGFNSAYGTKSRKLVKAMKAAMSEDRKTNTLKAVEKSGLVNTKISVYEKNLGSAKADGKQLNDSKRKKAVLGVPLIGMQNNAVSCPVLPEVTSASWKSPGTEYQFNIPNSKSAPASKAPSAISLQKDRDKTSTKRRAPSVPTNTAGSRDSRYTNNFKKSSLNANVTYPTKFMKNPYTTTKNGQLRPGRDFYQIRESAKTNSAGTTPPQSTLVNLRGSGGKRKTLYAKDANGEEAIRVLTNLCLNPLARNSKRASFMMW